MQKLRETKQGRLDLAQNKNSRLDSFNHEEKFNKTQTLHKQGLLWINEFTQGFWRKNKAIPFQRE